MKYLKTYKIFETSHEEIMSVHYGANVIQECDSIISDIKDMLLELQDIGFFITVGYTPMTLVYRENTPKIMVVIDSTLDLYNSNADEIKLSTDRIKEYVKTLGFSSGSGEWVKDERKTYQMLIQKH